MTVGELSSRMDSEEMTLWGEFYRIQGEAQKLGMELPAYLNRFRDVVADLED